MLATAVRAAEAMAPTRPHPGVETAAENVAVGPVGAVIDRTRDAVRKTMGKDSSSPHRPAPEQLSVALVLDTDDGRRIGMT
jgi:hypothetical protein